MMLADSIETSWLVSLRVNYVDTTVQKGPYNTPTWNPRSRVVLELFPEYLLHADIDVWMPIIFSF